MKYFFCFVFFYSTVHAQNPVDQIDLVNFKSAEVQITLSDQIMEVTGTVTYRFDVIRDVDSVLLNAKNLVNYKILLDGQAMTDPYNGKHITLRKPLKAGTTHKTTIQFISRPTKAFYFIDADSDGKWEQAWTQGQGKYTSNWLPSLDDVNDKIIWNITVEAPVGMTGIANGKLVSKNDNIYSYTMQNPMSSYLVAIVAGDYKSVTMQSDSDKEITHFYYPEDADKIATTYKHTQQIFDFLEKEIGVEYPWIKYKQIPVKDFLYSGMENTTATIFNDQFMVDSLAVNDRNYVTVNAHEMAHQWFGDLVTAQSGKHHWLQEGFATYYALLAERDLHGDAYFQVKLYEHAESLNRQNLNGDAKSLLDPTASSLTFYQHGAWALHALKDFVGESRFRESVKTYLQQYKYVTATTDEFLAIVEKVSGKNLETFKNNWLSKTEFPTMDAIAILRKNGFMRAYFNLISLREQNFEMALPDYKSMLEEPVEVELVKEMISQLQSREDPRKYDLLKDAASTGESTNQPAYRSHDHPGKRDES